MDQGGRRSVFEVMMSSHSKQALVGIFDSWKEEDRQLQISVDEVRDWMLQVNQLGIPHFGETATRLRPLKQRLFVHFGRELELISQLAAHYPPPSPEIEAVQKQSIRDHDQLLARLDDLIARLNLTEPPFQSWTEAMEEVGLFMDAIEQHEEHESDSIQMLMPGGLEDD